MPVREGIPCQRGRLLGGSAQTLVWASMEKGQSAAVQLFQRRAMRVRHVLINGGPGG